MSYDRQVRRPWRMKAPNILWRMWPLAANDAFMTSYFLCRRREFIAFVSCAAVAWATAAVSQTSGKRPLIAPGQGAGPR
jgi:hypothetical protein